MKSHLTNKALAFDRIRELVQPGPVVLPPAGVVAAVRTLAQGSAARRHHPLPPRYANRGIEHWWYRQDPGRPWELAAFDHETGLILRGLGTPLDYRELRGEWHGPIFPPVDPE